MGNAIDVNRMISRSLVKSRAHTFRIDTANVVADKPMITAINTATTADNLARPGWLAPSWLPTRVETANPREDGKI